MKFVIQRVKNAQVDVDNKTVGKRDNGFLVLIGVTHTDNKEIADYLVKKLNKTDLEDSTIEKYKKFVKNKEKC